MTSRRLLTLIVAALIAIGAGLWLATRQASTVADQERAALCPELKQQLDAVKSVRIYKAGDVRSVELVRQDRGWGVSERAGYPADEPKLRKLLRSLADAKVFEEKTSNPAGYKSLGVEDISESAATGVRLELTGQQAPVNLLVGKSGVGGESQYVRRAGEAQSWLVDHTIDTSASPDAWLRKDVLDVSADRVQAASVSIKGQKTYTAAKNSRADAGFSVTNLPKGKKLSSPSAANGFSTALSGLTLADVRPASAFDGQAPDAQATFTTFDGLVVQLDGWSRNDKRFVAVKTSHDAQVADRFKVATTATDDKASAGDTKPAPAAVESKTPNAAEEAKVANDRLAGWVYELPSYKYEQVFKPLEQLLPTS
jgi:Domain of unknown function (DUF4340)